MKMEQSDGTLTDAVEVASAGKVSILVIDDEPMVADTLKLILDKQGYMTAVALTGRDGLEQFHKGRFAAMITDLRLPDMSGLDVLTTIHKREADLPVIIITAHGTPEVIRESIRRGAAAVLLKPFSPADVLSLLETNLEHSPVNPHS